MGWGESVCERVCESLRNGGGRVIGWGPRMEKKNLNYFDNSNSLIHF